METTEIRRGEFDSDLSHNNDFTSSMEKIAKSYLVFSITGILCTKIGKIYTFMNLEVSRKPLLIYLIQSRSMSNSLEQVLKVTFNARSVTMILPLPFELMVEGEKILKWFLTSWMILWFVKGDKIILGC